MLAGRVSDVDQKPLVSWLLGSCEGYLSAVCARGRHQGLSLKSNWFAAEETTFLALAVPLLSAKEGVAQQKHSGLPRLVMALLQTRQADLAKLVFDRVFQVSQCGTTCQSLHTTVSKIGAKE